MRATSHEFRDHPLIHLPSLDALSTMSSEQTASMRLLLVDEFALAASSEAAHSIASGPVRIVLAYLDVEAAARRYHEAHQRPPIHSFVPLDVRLDVWLSLLKLLLHGGKYVPEELLNHRPHRHNPAIDRMSELPLLGLTRRQYDVLELVAEGHPNKVIALRLGLSDHTVKLHIHNIISRLGVTNRTEAAARFRDCRP
nr:LuxR C-terminal-related transcriptional regulator [Paracoccus saliphilus]